MSAAPKYMAVQGAAMIVAAALILIGALGFIPGVTSDVDQLAWLGRDSGARLFGTFAVCAAINVMHIVIGAAGFYFARTYAGSRAYLLVAGALYLALWFYGMFVEFGSDAHVIPLNSATNLLYLGLAIVLPLLAVTLAGQRDPTKRRPRPRIRRAASH